MGCCILAAIIASQFILLRRRLRSLFWPTRLPAATAEGASAWRPTAAPTIPTPIVRGSAMLQWQRVIVVLVAVACGYLLVAHAAHLRDLALGRSGAWQALIDDSWCGTFSSRSS